MKLLKTCFVFYALVVTTLRAQNTDLAKITLRWQLGYHKTLNEKPAKWLNSTVPGAVQLDVMRGENYKQPYWYGENWQQFIWMEPYFFTYKTSFKKPDLKSGQKLFFV